VGDRPPSPLGRIRAKVLLRGAVLRQALSRSSPPERWAPPRLLLSQMTVELRLTTLAIEGGHHLDEHDR
jgi:hypothetical protein